MTALKKRTNSDYGVADYQCSRGKRVDAGMEAECKQEEDRGRAVESVSSLFLRPELEAQF